MANVIKTHEYFPTVIHEFEFSADNKLLDAIKKENLYKPTHNTSTQSINNKINDKEEYKSLTNKILDTTKEICKDYEYRYEVLEITNMWVNYSSKGSMHRPHTHSNNIFSGVWYPFENTSKTPIVFSDPRPAASVLEPNIYKRNKYTASLVSFQSDKDKGFIFPSWLSHYVPPTLTDRISISWNVLLRGDYGEPNSLQNASI